MMNVVKNGILLILIGILSACNGEKTSQTSQKSSSAQANVSILQEAILIPGLDRKRTIRLYLPPSYADSNKRYPVLYMHDGQNLFDTATAYAGEWGVDETLNELAVTKGIELIVVGIDNGEKKRLNELSPWTNVEYGEAEGQQYMDFVVQVLKPKIDNLYRTKPEREHTAIMGSSMGGLISHYAIFQYPQVFSKAGIFSPSFWYSEEVYGNTASHSLPNDAKLYYLVGSKEGETTVEDLQRMVKLIEDQGHKNMQSKVVEGAEHNEGFWRSEFPAAIKWLFRS